MAIYFNSDVDIAGFQFNLDGVSILGAGGGAAADAGFTISNSATTVLGFSLTGDVIPAGEGVLLVLEVDGDTADACLSGVVISDSNGTAVDVSFEYFDGSSDDVAGCTDMDACNYNADATEDDGSCDYAEEKYHMVSRLMVTMQEFLMTLKYLRM